MGGRMGGGKSETDGWAVDGWVGGQEGQEDRQL